MQPEPFTCLLCAAAGQPTLAPRHRRTSLCQDHHASLRASGRGWCERGQHAVALPDWRRGVCRACDNARRAARYAAHRDEERARQAAYHAAHAEERRAYIRAWKARNPERQRAHVRVYMRKWRARNPERHRAANARWRTRNRAAIAAHGRQYRQQRKLRAWFRRAA